MYFSDGKPVVNRVSQKALFVGKAAACANDARLVDRVDFKFTTVM